MLFIENKYYTKYRNIISQALARQPTGYVEIHHIVPRSIGGTDDKHNLVSLTAREHLVCHLLLPRFTIGEARKKMFYAVHRMTNKESGEKIKTSRLFEYYRVNHAKAVAEDRSNNPLNGFRKTKGKTHEEIFGIERSREIKEIIRKSNSTRGVSQATKDKIARKQKQRYAENPELKIKAPFSEEHKKNIAKGRIDRFNSSEISYNWVHPKHGEFTGKRRDLHNAFTDQDIRINELGKVIDPKGNVSSHRKWRLK